ncbi:MAG: PhnD/SsuA/transferrin family substrate-binding protein [Burkholderiales bacterium]
MSDAPPAIRGFVVNARMYSVNAQAAQAWRTVLQWVVDRAHVDARVLDYPPPQPLPALWSRDDLAAAFMCGHPFSRAHPQPTLIAAPVPSPEAYGDRPVYWTCIVAREDSGIRSLPDTFGRRMAYTTPDSQSGYLALRALVATVPHPFASMVGPLVTPRRVVEAVLAGDADAGPVDSYALDLLRLHEPAWIAPLRVIATTPPTPIPPLVASPGLPADAARRIRDALLEVDRADALESARAALLLRRFDAADPAAYAVLRDPAGPPLL